MKKICILKGSPRKNGNTNALVKVMINTFERTGCQVAVFDLYDLNIKPCLACRACQKNWETVECSQDDDFMTVAKAVSDSDLILLASPIYVWYCTAPMKALLDRLSYAMNMYYGDEKGPSLWAGKSVAIVTTCGYRPEKGADIWEEGVKRFCKHSQLKYKGMLCERHMGYNIEFMDKEKAQNAEAFAEDLVRI